MWRRTDGLVILGWAVLAASGGACVNVDTRIPDVQINTPSGYGGGAASDRRTPYAKDLERVIEQQRSVQKSLSKRDWEDVDDDLASWAKDTRRLMGRADSTKNPAKMKECCQGLLAEIEAAQAAARSRDEKAVKAAVGRTDGWLNRLSADFPLTEPVPGDAGAAGNSRSVAP